MNRLVLNACYPTNRTSVLTSSLPIAMSNSRSAFRFQASFDKRFEVDVDELFRLPLPNGVTVIQDSSANRHLNVVVIPSSGHLKDLQIHLMLDVPLDWPLSPPRLSTLSCPEALHLDDLLLTLHLQHTFASTLRRLLHSLASSLELDHCWALGCCCCTLVLPKPDGAIVRKPCPGCSSKATALQSVQHPRSNRVSCSVLKSPIANLNADVLIALASFLDTPSLISLMGAWSHFNMLILEVNGLASRDQRCQLLALPASETILGIEVNVLERKGVICDIRGLLSFDAFRILIEGRIQPLGLVSYFLPLGFTPEHYGRAEGLIMEIWGRLGKVLYGSQVGLMEPPTATGTDEENMKYVVYAIVSLIRHVPFSIFDHRVVDQPPTVLSLTRLGRPDNLVPVIKAYFRLFRLLWLVSRGTQRDTFWKIVGAQVGVGMELIQKTPLAEVIMMLAMSFEQEASCTDNSRRNTLEDDWVGCCGRKAVDLDRWLDFQRCVIKLCHPACTTSTVGCKQTNRNPLLGCNKYLDGYDDLPGLVIRNQLLDKLREMCRVCAPCSSTQQVRDAGCRC